MLDNKQMEELKEKGFEALGTRNPTMEEYADYLFQQKKDSVK